MKVIKIEKSAGNGSLDISYYPDGDTEELVISSSIELLEDSNWTHLLLSYEDANGTFKLFKDAQLVEQSTGHFFNGSEISTRFSTMTIGDDSASYLGIIDDLRIYKTNLNQDDVTQIYGTGFGDFTRIEIIGSGQTRITATQFGNEDFEASLPQDNYLSVYKVPQQIEFGPIKDHSVGDFLFS